MLYYNEMRVWVQENFNKYKTNLNFGNMSNKYADGSSVSGSTSTTNRIQINMRVYGYQRNVKI